MTIAVVYQDIDPENPREWDNASTLHCWHGNYILGDADQTGNRDPFDVLHSYVSEIYGGNTALTSLNPDEQMQEYITDFIVEVEYSPTIDDIEDYNGGTSVLWTLLLRKAVVSPLYLYDHSGITMNTGGFSCPWDSGQVGFAIITEEKGVEEWGHDWREKAEARIKAEVEEYARYLEGNVYGYRTFDKNPAEHDGAEALDDSFWGFIGYPNDAVEMMKEHTGDIEFIYRWDMPDPVAAY